jgi:hypothetical protein
MIRFALLPFVLISVIFCGGCAFVDQYGARVNDANFNSQNALNDEILLNIVRASLYQSPNFIAISQVTGGQAETLTTGLPSIYVGPHTGNNPFTNAISSGVTGGYQSNPLLSTAFQNGMLSPVSSRTVALLIGSHPREAVFSLVLAGIAVTLPGNRYALLNNDPTDDDPGTSGKTCTQILNSPGLSPLYPSMECSFSKFHNLLKGLVANGLYAELTSSSGSSSGQGNAAQAAGTTSSGANGLPGKICFDPTRAGSKLDIVKEHQNICGSNQKQPQKEQDTGVTKTLSVKQTVSGVETTQTSAVTGTLPTSMNEKNVPIRYAGIPGGIQVTFVFRSPDAAIKYLGKWIIAGNKPFSYFTDEANGILNNEPYLNVSQGISSACYASISYDSRFFCVPSNSAHTAMLMDMIEDLRNLNIQPTDLNSAFTVRLAN